MTELVITIRIELPDGATVSLAAPAPAATAKSVVAALPPLPRAQRQGLGGTQRRVLEDLADHHGRISSPEGAACTRLADRIGMSATQAAGVIRKLEAEALVTCTRPSGRRMSRIVLTPAGWAAIDRTPVTAEDVAPPEVAAPPPSAAAMPVLGPIGARPFDADAVRGQAVEGI